MTLAVVKIVDGIAVVRFGENSALAAGFAQEATEAVALANAERLAAEAAATQAGLFAVAAGANLENSFDTYAGGMAATIAGDAFWVVDTETAKLYINGTSAGAGDPLLDIVGNAFPAVATRTALAAMLPVAGRAVLLAESGRVGTFIFVPGNLAGIVAIDTSKAVYVAPDTDTSGGTGAWVRQFNGPLTPQMFGAKGDGVTNDTVALQAALNYITASTKNRWLHIPTGNYAVTNLAITQTAGLKITGDGRHLGTQITATAALPALSINGLWYSQIEGIAFYTGSAQGVSGVVEQDGNYDGTHAQGTQGITWKDCLFGGRGLGDGIRSTRTFVMNRRGNSSAQGSENLFINCHFFGAAEDVYYQSGYNALSNQFIGGNFQDYAKNGIRTNGGTISCYGTGFQSTVGYQQVANGGYDIDVGSSGANEGIILSGCRTESMRFVTAGGANRVTVEGCVGVLSLIPWIANTAYGIATAAGKAVRIPNAIGIYSRVFLATTEGVSGATQPVWPSDGVSTVADGSIVWQELKFDFINVSSGFVNYDTSAGNAGRTKGPAAFHSRTVFADATMGAHEDTLFVDATAGPITVKFPPFADVNAGHRITIRKVDATANAVTLYNDVAGFEPGGPNYTIAGGAAAARTFQLGDTVGGVTRYIVIGAA